jgi:hypothetical protein
MEVPTRAVEGLCEEEPKKILESTLSFWSRIPLRVSDILKIPQYGMRSSELLGNSRKGYRTLDLPEGNDWRVHLQVTSFSVLGRRRPPCLPAGQVSP